MSSTAPAREVLDVQPRHPVRRTVLSLAALGLLLAAVLGVRQQVGLMGKQSDMKLAFPGIGAIDGEQWKCSSGEFQGHFTYSCYPPDAPTPTVNYELLPAPQTPEELVADVEEENAELIAQDSSGTTPTAVLIDVADWTPTGELEPWGTVTRWRFDGVEGPTFQATYRYADRPYGVTVYAESPARVDELIGSLALLPPDRLPD